MYRKPWSLLLSGAVLLLTLWPGGAHALNISLDPNPPSVTILSPGDESTVQGQVLIEADAYDGLLGSGISRVEYQFNTTLGNWTELSLDLQSDTYKHNWETTTFADGSYNLYVRAVDNVGNMRTESVVVRIGNPPAAPTGLQVTAPAPPSNGGYLDLYWNPNMEADRAGYNLYRSTSPGGPYVKVALVPTNAYRDTGLTNETTYYYVVTAVDTAGNESKRSGEAGATPQDTRRPTIAGLTASKVTRTGAEITWTTDEPATGRVEYGTTSSLGAAATATEGVATSHRAALAGLRPGTTYFYRVRSADAAGHEAVSGIQSFTTQADNRPTVTIHTPAEGAVLGGPATMQVSAGDDWGLGAVEYSLDGITWQAMGYNSFSGYYEAKVDPQSLGEGPHTLGARAFDDAGQSTLMTVDVTVDTQAPALTVITPGEDAHLQGGLVHTFQAEASDTGTGVAAVESQVFLVPFGTEVETPPNPDPAAWQSMAFNAQSGYWEIPYQAPIIVTEREGWAYTRATDGSGKSTSAISPLTLLPNGREFAFTTATGGTLSGMVTIEQIGGAYRIGVDMVGRDLQPGGTYTLTIRGEGHTLTVTLTADARGRGVLQYEADSELTDEFGADLTLTEPGA